MNKPQCPNCGQEISLSLYARAMNESRVVLTLTPSPGEYMAARAIGGSIDGLAKLLKAVGRDIGVETVPLIERVETMESGELRFHLLLTNVRPKSGRSVGTDVQGTALPAENIRVSATSEVGHND